MSIDRWMNKDYVVYTHTHTHTHTHNGILLSYKKECIWVSSNEVHEPRVYIQALHSIIEWSNSEREKISYINEYIWNLKWWHWWTYLQGSKGDADIENKLVETLGEGEGGMIRE